MDPISLRQKDPSSRTLSPDPPPRRGQAGTLRAGLPGPGLATERDLRFQVHAETGLKLGHRGFRKPLAHLCPPVPRTGVTRSHRTVISRALTALPLPSPPMVSPEAATGPGSPLSGLMWEKGGRSVLWSLWKCSPKCHVSRCPGTGRAHSTHSAQGISWPAGCPVLE